MAKDRLQCRITSVSLNPTDSEIEFKSNNITSDGLVTTVTFNISTSTTDDKNHNVTTLISHESNLIAKAGNPLPLSKL